jgi:hypothetical protein
MQPIIHFCANSTGSHEIVHALYEIGCRIGRLFTIHRSIETLPQEGAVVLVGERPSPWPSNRPIVTLARPRKKIGRISQCLLELGQNDDLLGCVVSLLGFLHEDRSKVDAMQRTPPEQNELVADGVVHQPWLELIAQEIWRRLTHAGCGDVPAQHAWSQDRVYLCLTHDVDGPEMFSPFAMLRSGILGLACGNTYERESLIMSLLFRLEGLPDPYFNFALWREYESLFGGRSTFFVYPGRLNTAKWHRNDPKYDPHKGKLRVALEETVKAGWEIGVHFGIRSHGQAPYREAHQLLSETFSTNVVGARGHYWMMDWHNPYHTWREMLFAGYSYDMTLSPMTLGFRGGFMLPISPSLRWGREDPTDFVVIPSAVMDAYTVPRDAGLQQKKIDTVLDQLMDAAQQHGGVLVLDWHERTFINRGAWTGYLSPLTYLISEACARGGVSIIAGRELVTQWRNHVRSIFGGIV